MRLIGGCEPAADLPMGASQPDLWDANPAHSLDSGDIDRSIHSTPGVSVPPVRSLGPKREILG